MFANLCTTCNINDECVILVIDNKYMGNIDNHRQLITCLIGDPVDHSVSDVMFAYFAKKTGILNYHHLKLYIPHVDAHSIERAMSGLTALHFKGANITLPYKQDVMMHLDEIEQDAKRVGAVNTIVNSDGRLVGYNTDGWGAIRSIESKLRSFTNNDEVLVFGAGGAARAIIGSLPVVSKITIVNRADGRSQSEKVREDFREVGLQLFCEDYSDDKVVSLLEAATYVVNATPVGMFPLVDQSVVDESIFLRLKDQVDFSQKYFFDAVFNPYETLFLQVAKKYGASTCPGIYMMIYQGIRAFELWTGRRFPEDEVENVRNLLQLTINNQYE